MIICPLISKIELLMKDKELTKIIEDRLNEFSKNNLSSNRVWFSELCFCLLTANWKAREAIEIQNELGFNGFYNLSETDLFSFLKKKGHRFPLQRAKRIILARNFLSILKEKIISLDFKSRREWLVNNIFGFGYKEASHFLRNVGYNNYAIIDRHILKILCDERLCLKPKTLTKNKYLEIESILLDLCEKLNTTQAKLDLYLWYIENKNVLK